MVFSDSPDRTLECAIVLEEIAEMAYYTTNINRSIIDEFDEFTEELYTKHFERKNGNQQILRTIVTVDKNYLPVLKMRREER